MGFTQARQTDKGLVGGWARIWEIDRKDKYSVVNISTSKKIDGKFETDFSCKFVRLVGRAHEVMKSVAIPDKKGVGIQILNSDVTTNAVKGDDGTTKIYTNFVVYDLNVDGQTQNATQPKENKSSEKPGFMNVPDGIDEELPFN